MDERIDDNEGQTRPLLLDERPEARQSALPGSERSDIAAPSLSLQLRIIFGLDGINLALPMMALLYLVNERVQMPVSLLPSYAAFSFLPCSLKPLYAALSLVAEQMGVPRHRQIAILLTLSASTCAGSILIPPRAVVVCFTMAFVRCLWSSWPEFLFGLTLIDEAVAYETRKRQHYGGDRRRETSDSYAETAALFQSQSATARSWGCVLAHVLVLAFLFLLQWVGPLLTHSNDESNVDTTHLTTSNVLNHSTMSILFLMTATSNLVGAAIAWTCRIGETSLVDTIERSSIHSSHATSSDPMATPWQESKSLSRHTSYDSIESRDPFDVLELETEKQPTPKRMEVIPSAEQRLRDGPDVDTAPPVTDVLTSSINIALVVLLQASAIVFTMRQPVIHASSVLCWNVLAFLSVILLTGGLVGAVYAARRNAPTPARSWIPHHYGVGLFLMLRQAIPSVSYLMSSYMYIVFAPMPWFLQVLSLWDMLVTTGACWTYGKWLSKYSRGQQLQWLITGTTILAAVTSFGNVALIRVLDPEKSHFSSTVKIGLTLVMNALLGFTSEWKFLPDLVLATVSVDAMAPTTAATREHCCRESSNIDASSTPLLIGGADDNVEQLCTSHPTSASVGLQYGTFVSCIDFGGQLGALLAGPLVALVGTTRDNDWAHLDWLQVVNAVLMLFSLGFLILLRRENRLD